MLIRHERSGSRSVSDLLYKRRPTAGDPGSYAPALGHIDSHIYKLLLFKCVEGEGHGALGVLEQSVMSNPRWVLVGKRGIKLTAAVRSAGKMRH